MTGRWSIVAGAVGLAVFGLVWELLVRLLDVRPFILQAPSKITTELVDRPRYYLDASLVTLRHAGIGLLCALVVAVLVGAVMAASRFVEQAAQPVLMLRGLQTAGEIRTRSGRLHEFKTVAEVEAPLQFLIDKYPPLVARLDRAPGTKEPRYGQLLGGEISTARDDSAFGAASTPAPSSRIGQLEEEVANLRLEVADLKAQFEAFRQQFQ